MNASAKLTIQRSPWVLVTVKAKADPHPRPGLPTDTVAMRPVLTVVCHSGCRDRIFSILQYSCGRSTVFSGTPANIALICAMNVSSLASCVRSSCLYCLFAGGIPRSWLIYHRQPLLNSSDTTELCVWQDDRAVLKSERCLGLNQGTVQHVGDSCLCR